MVFLGEFSPVFLAGGKCGPGFLRVGILKHPSKQKLREIRVNFTKAPTEIHHPVGPKFEFLKRNAMNTFAQHLYRTPLCR